MAEPVSLKGRRSATKGKANVASVVSRGGLAADSTARVRQWQTPMSGFVQAVALDLDGTLADGGASAEATDATRQGRGGGLAVLLVTDGSPPSSKPSQVT